MRERGLSPIIATVLLITVTVIASGVVAWWLASYYTPMPKHTDLEVYAGLINENIVRFHILHIGGESIRIDETKPSTEKIRAWAKDPVTLVENELYCWTFEKPNRFRQSDWAYAEVQIHGAEFALNDTIEVRIVRVKAGILYDGTVTIKDINQIRGS